MPCTEDDLRQRQIKAAVFNSQFIFFLRRFKEDRETVMNIQNRKRTFQEQSDLFRVHRNYKLCTHRLLRITNYQKILTSSILHAPHAQHVKLHEDIFLY